MHKDTSHIGQHTLDYVANQGVMTVGIDGPPKCRIVPYRGGDADCCGLDFHECDGRAVVKVGRLQVCKGCWPTMVRAKMRIDANV